MIRTRSLLGLVALVGCDTNVIHVGDNPTEMKEVATIPSIVNRDLDVLFMIDDSPSMADKQTSLLASFPKMMDQLESLEGGLPNVHIGVATSDLGAVGTNGVVAPQIGATGEGGCAGHGDDGRLQYANATGLTGTFIDDIDDGAGGRTRNYTGELRDVFTSIANVGENGCGFEQTLGAMQHALDPANVANAGFIRPLANLAIVILSDEDDCTASDTTSLLTVDTTVLGPLQSFRCTRYGVTCDDGGTTTDAMNTIGTKSGCHTNAGSPNVASVQPIIDFVKDLKDDPSQVMVAAIVGNPDPVQIELRAPPGSTSAIPALAHSCQYTGTDGSLEVADPAVRTAQFVSAFDNRGALTSVCDADLSLPLENIGLRAKQLMGDPCIPIALAHPASPSCVVTDGTAPIPACDTTTGDCWRIVSDTFRCAQSPNQLRVEIVRATTPTQQRYAHVKCVIAP
ncbi:MAG TPA: hypothetical protein VF403_13605 [Kofleriaceae bacterium]